MGPGPRDIPSTDTIMQGHIEELKSQLAHRDGLIVKLQNELQSSRDDRISSAEEIARRDVVLDSAKSTLSSIHGREQQRMVSETDKDITIMKLKTTLRHAEQNRKDAMYEMVGKEENIDKLRFLVNELQNELVVRDSEVILVIVDLRSCPTWWLLLQLWLDHGVIMH